MITLSSRAAAGFGVGLAALAPPSRPTTNSCGSFAGPGGGAVAVGRPLRGPAGRPAPGPAPRTTAAPASRPAWCPSRRSAPGPRCRSSALPPPGTPARPPGARGVPPMATPSHAPEGEKSRRVAPPWSSRSSDAMNASIVRRLAAASPPPASSVPACWSSVEPGRRPTTHRTRHLPPPILSRPRRWPLGNPNLPRETHLLYSATAGD